MTTDKDTLESLDPILGPVFAKRADAPAANVALALLVRADEQAPLVAPWIRSRCAHRRDLVALTNRSSVWPRLMAKAARHSSRDAFDPLPLARRISGRFFSPAPAGAGRAEANMRAAFAIIAKLQIESVTTQGRDTIALGAPTLALLQGTSLLTAKKTLTRLVDLGWIKVVTKVPGLPSRFRIPTQTKAEYLATKDSPDRTDLVLNRTSIFNAADHPGFAGSHRVWLWAVARESGIDPTSLGLARRELSKLAIQAEDMGLDEADPIATLDGYADVLGLTDRRTEKAAIRTSEAAKKKAEILDHRLARKASSGLDAMESQVGQWPAGSTSLETKTDYALELAAAVQQALSAIDHAPELVPAIEREMVSRGRTAGWASDDLELLVA